MEKITETLHQWLFDPAAGKLVLALAGLLAIYIIVFFIRRSMVKYVSDTNSRYRARKFIGMVGYVLGALFLALVFSDRLGGLTSGKPEPGG